VGGDHFDFVFRFYALVYALVVEIRLQLGETKLFICIEGGGFHRQIFL